MSVDVDRDDAILAALTLYGLPEMRRYFKTRNACIAAARVGLDVLRYFGVDAKPMPVRTLVMNATAVEWLNTLGLAAFQERHDDVAAAGGWVVETDVASVTPGQYAGHLVILAGLRLVDLTADQFARPAKGIEIPDGLVLKFVDGQSRAQFIADQNGIAANLDGGSLIVYRRLRSRAYTNAKDWRLDPPPGLAGRIIRRIREEIEQ